MRINDLCKSYQVAGRRLDVLKNLRMEADNSGITVVLGRSGCGKTTLLRLIAGLEQADSGQIIWEKGTGGVRVPSGERLGGEGGQAAAVRLGVIFQEPRLMPWLTTADNILFGVDKKEARREERLARLLKLTGLEGFEKAYPGQLSGGMQQRTALARALACDPDYLLMDEPFAALDYFTRRQMQKELVQVWRKEKKGVLFVTHSIEEALAIGTKIIILDGGGCRKEYDLADHAYPRDLLDPDLVYIKKDIIEQIEEREETRL